MKSIRIAGIIGLILVLAEAGWWGWRNRPRHAADQPAMQLAPAAKPVPLQTNGSPGSANAISTALLPVAASTSNPSAAAAETTAQRLGPFSLAGTEYSVILKSKKRPPGSTQEAGTTVIAMEIRDGAGRPVYQKNFPYQPDETEFSDAWSVSAAILSGTNGSGLLVTYDEDSEPSAPEPESSGWYQVFGVVNGKLKPFSGPILVQGDLIQPDEKSKIYKTAGPLDLHSDALNFKVWAHHFRLIYPIRVDWSQGKLSPALACDKANSSPAQTCRYGVLPENERPSGGLTFVQFCQDPSPCDHPERVLVKPDSKVELLGTVADVKWSEGQNSPPTGNNPLEDQGGIGVGTENLELQVRIDGKQGWIHTDEDFNALGLPFEQ